MDTNVISEMMRPRPNESVRQWFHLILPQHLWTTSITKAEIGLGLAYLTGSRREELARSAKKLFRLFLGKLLFLDDLAADYYPGIVIGRQQAGRPVKELDAQIAAIARSRDMSVATRNLRDFEDCGVDLIDPWNAHR